jgi:cytochrome c-type biogenesis protein CcmH/NrfG
MGTFAEALEDFETAVRLSPDNPEFQEGLDKCRQSLQQS